jgi:predicted aspartyl protease
MKTWMKGQHSGPARSHRSKHWFGSRLSTGVAGGLIVFLGSCLGSFCLASPLPSHKDVEKQALAKTEIPFELYNDNLIIVKATIGPIKNVNMILDTGTSPTAITKEIADRLKLRGETESLETLNGAIQTQSLVLPRIQIGPLQARSLRVVVQDLSFMEQGLGISLGGIVGLDILSTNSFTIDYPKRKIAFGPIVPSEKTVHFETRVPFLTVKAEINGQKVRLLVDSGTGGLLVYRNRLQTTKEQLRLDPNTSITSTGGMTHLRWLRAAVSIGGDNLGARNVAIADGGADRPNDFDGLLGFAKMGFRKVSFDFENGLFGWE